MNDFITTPQRHLNRQSSSQRWRAAQDVKREAIDFLVRQGWRIRTSKELSSNGKRYGLKCVRDGKMTPMILQFRDGGPDILSELYSPFYAVDHPWNLPGRDL